MAGFLSASVQKPDGKRWVGVKMKVREARVERFGRVRAQPAPARRLFRAEVFSGSFCIPVVKFVCGNLLTCAAEKIVYLRGERHIAEACELPRVEAAPLQRARHREASDFLGQVHEAAALGDAGKTAGDSFANRFAHRLVLRERFGVELGVAARKIEPLKVFRERFIFQRAEIDKLRAEFSEKR